MSARVTEADMDAAASYIGYSWSALGPDSPLARAFARHRQSAIAELCEGLREARGRFAAIAEFGDPWEITEEPEEFGGTDDGQETVCMAYENMQSIASTALAKLEALLSKHSPDAPGDAGTRAIEPSDGDEA